MQWLMLSIREVPRDDIFNRVSELSNVKEGTLHDEKII